MIHGELQTGTNSFPVNSFRSEDMYLYRYGRFQDRPVSWGHWFKWILFRCLILKGPESYILFVKTGEIHVPFHRLFWFEWFEKVFKKSWNHWKIYKCFIKCSQSLNWILNIQMFGQMFLWARTLVLHSSSCRHRQQRVFFHSSARPVVKPQGGLLGSQPRKCCTSPQSLRTTQTMLFLFSLCPGGVRGGG